MREKGKPPEITRVRVKCPNCGEYNMTLLRTVRCDQCGEFVTILRHVSGPELCPHQMLAEWCKDCAALHHGGK